LEVAEYWSGWESSLGAEQLSAAEVWR